MKSKAVGIGRIFTATVVIFTYGCDNMTTSMTTCFSSVHRSLILTYNTGVERTRRREGVRGVGGVSNLREEESSTSFFGVTTAATIILYI